MKSLLIAITSCLSIGCSRDNGITDLSPTYATRAMVTACLNHDFDAYICSFSTNAYLQQEYLVDNSTYTLGAVTSLKIMFNMLVDELEKNECTIDDVMFSVRDNEDLPARWKLKPNFRWVDVTLLDNRTKDEVVILEPYLVHYENEAWKIIDRSHAHEALQNGI